MASSTSAARRVRRPAGIPSPAQMFFQGFLKHPVMVGSIIPSSDKLIRKMLDRVDWNACKLFVEYGPGVGPAIAAATHAALNPGGAFLVYQFSPKVKDFLVPHWQRIDHDMEWWNVPPAQLYWAWKD